jgi:hypothetical protein
MLHRIVSLWGPLMAAGSAWSRGRIRAFGIKVIAIDLRDQVHQHIALAGLRRVGAVDRQSTSGMRVHLRRVS